MLKSQAKSSLDENQQIVPVAQFKAVNKPATDQIRILTTDQDQVDYDDNKNLNEELKEDSVI